MITPPGFKQLALPFLPEHDVWYFEQKAKRRGYRYIAGVDEAGRGPLAGPVVAAAVILPGDFSIPGIDDSKKLTPKKRSKLYHLIYNEALSVGIGMACNNEIDEFNILEATFIAMKRAINSLSITPDYVFVDGIHKIPGISIHHEAIPKGDQLCLSVSAASIIAKVTRDTLMEAFHKLYPLYNFKANKGYGTAEHREAIRAHGCSPIHRKTFRGVREFIT